MKNVIRFVVVMFIAMQYLGCGGKQVVPKLAFEHKVIDPNPPSAKEGYLDVAAVGDIDGDGVKDIMLGSQFTLGAVWYHSPDWKRYPIAPGDFTTDGEVVDLDNDGDGDVLLSTDTNDLVEWYENSGDPFSGGWTKHHIGEFFAHDLAVADVNGDGRPDVAAFCKYKQIELVMYLAPDEKNGTWDRVVIARPEGEGLDLGDLDGDGDADMAAGKVWYENVNADGKTWTPHTISESWGVDCRDIIIDMNGDGRKDVVLAHSEGEGGISWFEAPSWTEHRIEGGKLTGAHTLEVADFDKDGDPDVFTGEMHTSPQKLVAVYENLGKDTWKQMILSANGTHNGRIGDIDGDGDIDLVGKNYEGPKVLEVWENKLLSK